MSAHEQRCWNCNARHEEHSGVDGNEQYVPTPGSVSICLYCGEIGIYEDDCWIRPPTSDERAELLADDRLNRIRGTVLTMIATHTEWPLPQDRQ